MVLHQIETEVSILSSHLLTECPSLEFIIVHAKAILQLAEGLLQTPPTMVDSERDAQMVREYDKRADTF